MTNKCSGCGAPLPAEQMQCPFCNTVQTDNSNEALLDQLMNLVRKYQVAVNRGDKMIVEQLLADGCIYTLVDGGDPETCDRKTIVECRGINAARSFFSYSFSNEKLLERTADAAKVSCIDTTCRHYEKGILFPDGQSYEYARTKVDFVRHNGRWQIAAIHETSIDEDGNDC